MKDDTVITLNDAMERSVGALLLVGAVWLVSGPAILLYQSLVWLKTALWPEYPLHQALGIWPSVSWHGAQIIIDWVMKCPLSGFLFFTFLIYSLVTLNFGEYLEKKSASIKSARAVAEKEAEEEKRVQERRDVLKADEPRRHAELRAIAERVKSESPKA